MSCGCSRTRDGGGARDLCARIFVRALTNPRFGARTALIVAAATAVQALVSMATMILPAIAPRAAASLGVPSALIGFQVSLMYAFATAISLVSGRFVRRFGPVRTNQIALLLAAAGLTLSATASLAMIAVGSILMGIGYGLPNPAASHLLMRFTPAHRRNFVFSLKQTGVPLGGVLAGLTAPALAELVDWRAPLLATALAAASIALVFAFARARWDDDRDASHALFRAPLEGIWSMLAVAPLRHLCAIGFLLAAVQVCLVTFLVVLLVEDYGLSIVMAGMVLGLVQVAGVIGRVGWGLAADATHQGLRTLLAIGVVIVALALVLAFAARSASLAVVVLTLLGATAIGWNGVFLAETARLAPAGRVGEATGIILSLTYLGVFVGPALFGMAAPLLGGYRSAFLLLALAAAVASVFASIARRSAERIG